MNSKTTSDQTQHTPGPWFVDDSSVIAHVPTGSNRVHGYGYGCGSQGFICDLDDGEYHEYNDKNEMRANARLIAAAPDLLAACKAMDQPHRGGTVRWVHNASITQDIEALRAIALAHGHVWNTLMGPAIARAEGLD